MIRCKVCQTKFHCLASHLRKHNLTTTTYREQFPGAPTISKRLSRQIGETSHRNNTTPQNKERVRQQLAKQKQDPEFQRRWKAAVIAELKVRNNDPEFKKRQRTAVRKSVAKQRQDPKFVQKLLDAVTGRKHTPEEIAKQRAAWTPELREQQAERTRRQWEDPEFAASVAAHASKNTKRLWKDPEYRRKVHGKRKWYKPELACKQLLVDLGLWGPEASPVRFYDHKDIPRQADRPDSKFSFNADFATKCGLIIHVDGWYHYSPKAPNYEWRKRRDAKIDRWCIAHGYLFLRLTDWDIYHRPKWCRNMIRRLVRRDIVPLMP